MHVIECISSICHAVSSLKGQGLHTGISPEVPGISGGGIAVTGLGLVEYRCGTAHRFTSLAGSGIKEIGEIIYFFGNLCRARTVIAAYVQGEHLVGSVIFSPLAGISTGCVGIVNHHDPDIVVTGAVAVFSISSADLEGYGVAFQIQGVGSGLRTSTGGRLIQRSRCTRNQRIGCCIREVIGYGIDGIGHIFGGARAVI